MDGRDPGVDGGLEALANAVRDRSLGAAELVRAALERIERFDGELNAVVALREEAEPEASRLDERIARGEDPGPLAGVPVLVKDLEDVAGMRTTFGSLVHAEDPPAGSDGLVPGRLRAAGAIVVGKTNLPEFAFEGYTANRLFGVTRNPWAPEWSPGGSSGGSGAAMAAGMVPVATATDGGGSIRIPAAFCGLAGIKPTAGVVGRSPIPDWIDYSTDGPLARSIADLRLLLSVEAGPVPGDPTAVPAWGRDGGGLPGGAPPVRPPARVLAAPRFVPWGPLPGPVQESFDAALRGIETDLGLPVEPVEMGSIFGSGNPDEDWFLVCAAEHAHGFGRERIEREASRYDPRLREIMEEGLRISMEDYLAARRRRFDYVRDLDELLGEDAVIATPTLCEEGWLADGRMPGAGEPGTPESVYNTQVQNITGHPALSVPAGRSPNGVPFGLQFTGPRFRDDLLLVLGEAWESANPWPLAAPGYEPFPA